MSKVTFDTSVFITYKPAKLPAGFVLSAVVVQELAAGALDKSDLQKLNAARRVYEKENRLLVPTGEDWWLAGKVLNSLLRGLKSKAKGLAPRMSKAEQQRIIRDVLIAITAQRAGALVVTDNLRDFEKIRRFCNLRLKSGADFFNLGGI